MKNLKISVKLFWPHIVILLLLVAGITVNVVSLLDVGKQIEFLYEGAYTVKNAAITMEASFEEIQKSIFRTIINDSQDIANEESVNIKNNAVIIQEQIDLIKQNPLADRAVISKLEEYLHEFAPIQEHVLAMAAQNKNLEAVAYMENRIIPAIKEEQRELAQFIQSAEAKERELVASLRQTQKNAIVLLISFGVSSVLFNIVAGIHIWRIHKKENQSMINQV